MKILSIGNFTTGWDGSICDEEHIAGALEELGHIVHRHQREEANIETHLLPEIDFILIAQWEGFHEEVIPRLKERHSCPVVYWAFDYQADGQEWHEMLVAEADLYLSKRIADSKYPNWQWLAQDFAPKFLHKYNGDMFIEKDIDVLFTGSYLPWATERNKTLKAVNEKFNLVIHSVNVWPEEFKDVRPPIMDKGLPELYARAKVIIAIDHTLERGYWSDRIAQIMCCGARPLVRHIPLMESTFHDYVDYFYDIDSCLKLIDFKMIATLKDEDHYRYAQANLKVTSRVQDLLTIVKSIL